MSTPSCLRKQQGSVDVKEGICEAGKKNKAKMRQLLFKRSHPVLYLN